MDICKNRFNGYESLFWFNNFEGDIIFYCSDLCFLYQLKRITNGDIQHKVFASPGGVGKVDFICHPALIGEPGFAQGNCQIETQYKKRNINP